MASGESLCSSGAWMPPPMGTRTVIGQVKAPRVRYVLKPEDGAGHGYVMDRLAGERVGALISERSQVAQEIFASSSEHLDATNQRMADAFLERTTA